MLSSAENSAFSNFWMDQDSRVSLIGSNCVVSDRFVHLSRTARRATTNVTKTMSPYYRESSLAVLEHPYSFLRSSYICRHHSPTGSSTTHLCLGLTDLQTTLCTLHSLPRQQARLNYVCSLSLAHSLLPTVRVGQGRGRLRLVHATHCPLFPG